MTRPDPALVAAVRLALRTGLRFSRCSFCGMVPDHDGTGDGDREEHAKDCPLGDTLAALVASWVGPLLVEHKIVTKMVEINANSWWAYATELAEAHKVALAALPWRKEER